MVCFLIEELLEDVASTKTDIDAAAWILSGGDEAGLFISSGEDAGSTMYGSCLIREPPLVTGILFHKSSDLVKSFYLLTSLKEHPSISSTASL